MDIVRYDHHNLPELIRWYYSPLWKVIDDICQVHHIYICRYPKVSIISIVLNWCSCAIAFNLFLYMSKTPEPYIDHLGPTFHIITNKSKPLSLYNISYTIKYIVSLSRNIFQSVGIYCKLIPDWIKLTRARILFPAQYRTKFKNTTSRNILKIE